MAELRETHTIFGPFLDWDPLDTAVLFFRTNRYQVVSTAQGPIPEELERTSGPVAEEADGDVDAQTSTPPPERPDEVVTQVKLERGARGKGWTTSNLAELHTQLDLMLTQNKVQLSYVVSTTGQHLRGDERDFWKREAKALEDYLLHEGAIPNLAAEERQRAGEIRRDFLVMGLWIGAVTAVIIFVVVATLTMP